MSKTKTLIVTFLIAILAVAAASVTISTKAATRPEPAYTIRIQTVLYVGDMEPIDCSSKAKFSSSDETIAYVDEDGFIVAAAPGEAVITVKEGKKSNNIEIYVPNGCIPGDHNYQINDDKAFECSKCHDIK